MNISKKYGRTYHYPFSPGTTSDDRVAHEYWRDVSKHKMVIHTEKLDGENNCLSRDGVFARSHASPTTSPWTSAIRERWQSIKYDLGDLEFFGENLYAVHSIEYRKLESHYFVFAVRINETWLSWDEVLFYAAMFDFPTVPVLRTINPADKSSFEHDMMDLVQEPSVFDSYDAITGLPCQREGIVSRNADEYTVGAFEHNVFKYVRKNHVKTNEHWTRTWRRAKLSWEIKAS